MEKKILMCSSFLWQQTCDRVWNCFCFFLTPLQTMVNIGSNFEAIEPLGTARRWSKKDKHYIGVARPALIGSYNKSKGGTDRMDQAISTYQPFVYNTNWYWPIFLYYLEVSLYNSWLLYRMFEKDCPFLKHVQSIANSCLDLHQNDRRVFKTEETMFRNSRAAKRVDPRVGFDGKNNLLEPDHTKSRCALCGKTFQIWS